MRKDEVAARVRAVANKVAEETGKRGELLALPVYARLQQTEPEVMAYLKRYHKGYEMGQIKVWLPR